MSSPETHALLGASSAHRWLLCTPSARLEAQVPDTGESSPFAAQGTEAHALAELELSRETGKISKRQYAARMRTRKASEYHDEEMVEAVSGYVDTVMGIVRDMRDELGSEPYVDLEQRVDFSGYVPEGFGTADVVLVCGDVVHVVDLKYGKGVPVDARDNPQLRLYAIGAVDKYDVLGGFREARMTIVQPRLSSSSTDVVAVDELRSWASDYVQPRARLAWRGEGEFAPGDDTCRFCRVRATCRARADAALETAREDFGAETLTDEEIAELLPRLDDIEAWCRDVKDYALQQMLDGRASYEGYKLVEGRSTRSISDPERAMDVLDKAGIPAEDYLKPYQLKGITALTKALGKKRFGELLGDLVVKPAGKPALVPESDRRPAISGLASAKEDFS